MSNTAKKEITLGGGDGSIASFLGPADLAKGQELTGVYLGSAVMGPYSTLTHKIETKDGIIGLNGSGQLNKKIAQVVPGSEVTIVYNGTAEMKKGQFAGTKAHQFSVFADVPEVDDMDESDL